MSAITMKYGVLVALGFLHTALFSFAAADNSWMIDLAELRNRVISEGLPALEAEVGPVEEIGFFFRRLRSHYSHKANEVVFAAKTKTRVGNGPKIIVGINMGTDGNTYYTKLNPSLEHDEIVDLSFASLTKAEIGFIEKHNHPYVTEALRKLKENPEIDSKSYNIDFLTRKWGVLEASSFSTMVAVLNALHKTKALSAFQLTPLGPDRKDEVVRPVKFLGTGKKSSVIDLARFAGRNERESLVLSPVPRCKKAL